MSTASARFAVVDDRSRFAAVSLGWRGADAAVLRARVDVAQPVSAHWTRSEGAHCLTALLPHAEAADWADRAIAAARQADPVLAIVGSARGVAEAERIAVRPARPSAALPSALEQKREQGFESTVVTGADPAAAVGHAATFLAICRLAAGPGTLIPATLRAAGDRAVVQLARALRRGRAGLTWQVVSPAGEGIPTLETVLGAALGGSVARGAEADAARAFARANLSRPWRSPEELARTLVEYEVMGWGGAIVRDPDASLDAVDAAALDRAVAALLRPVADVVGWG